MLISSLARTWWTVAAVVLLTANAAVLLAPDLVSAAARALGL